MVLRLYKKKASTVVLRPVTRLTFSQSGNLAVQTQAGRGYVWKKYLRGKDFHSFDMATE